MHFTIAGICGPQGMNHVSKWHYASSNVNSDGETHLLNMCDAIYCDVPAVQS